MRRPPARLLAPLRLSSFRLLFFATLGSSIGTLLAAIALAIDVKDRTNSGVWVGAVLLVEFLPTVLVGLLLGPWLDRFERRRLMLAADVVRAGVFFTLPFVDSAGAIVALAAVAGLANGFFRPAVYAGVPNLVPEEQLAPANALLQTVENASWAIGPLLGGVITAAAGPDTAYWINGVSFVVSAAFVVRIPARMLQSATAISQGHWRDLREGFGVALRSHQLLAVLLGWGIACLGMGAINVSEIFFAKNTLDGGDFGYGLMYGAMGTGLVLGSFASSTVVERVGIARAYGGALGLMAIGFGVGALSVNIWMAAVCCVVGGTGDGMAVVCNSLLVQRGAPDEVRGRVLTFIMSATFGLLGISTILAGVLMSPDDARWVWFGSSLVLGVAAVVGYTLARQPERAGVRRQAHANV